MSSSGVAIGKIVPIEELLVYGKSISRPHSPFSWGIPEKHIKSNVLTCT